MSKEQWTAIDNYFTNLFMPEDAALTQALKDCEEAGLDPIAVAPNQGKLLYILAQLNNSKRILEIGTLGGYSTIWMAKALPEGGKVITLEIDQKCADIAQKNIERAGLQDKVEIRVGSALDIMKEMSAAGEAPFDFVFIDQSIYQTGNVKFRSQFMSLLGQKFSQHIFCKLKIIWLEAPHIHRYQCILI